MDVREDVETILVVDDDGMVLRVVEAMLRKHGYTVIAAKNGPDALRMFAAADGRIQLVITDVVMPGMDGMILARELRSRRPDVPVLFISGYAESRVRLNAPVLMKPFSSTTLVAQVRKVLQAGPARRS